MIFTQRDLKLFDAAKAVAKTSRHAHKHGAIFAQNQDIVAIGVNGIKSHPLQAKYDSLRFNDDSACHLLHAELDAIIKAKAHIQAFDNAALYVYRIMRDGSDGMSRPCRACFGAIKDFGIRDIYYSTLDGLVYERIAK